MAADAFVLCVARWSFAMSLNMLDLTVWINLIFPGVIGIFVSVAKTNDAQSPPFLTWYKHSNYSTNWRPPIKYISDQWVKQAWNPLSNHLPGVYTVPVILSTWNLIHARFNGFAVVHVWNISNFRKLYSMIMSHIVIIFSCLDLCCSIMFFVKW